MEILNPGDCSDCIHFDKGSEGKGKYGLGTCKAFPEGIIKGGNFPHGHTAPVSGQVGDYTALLPRDFVPNHPGDLAAFLHFGPPVEGGTETWLAFLKDHYEKLYGQKISEETWRKAQEYKPPEWKPWENLSSD